MVLRTSFILIVTILVISGKPSECLKIPCALKWVNISLGEIPDASIPTSRLAGTEYIGRGLLENEFLVGGIEPNSGLLYVVNGTGTGVEILTSYEILTNPHRCIIKWDLEINDYSVPAGSSNFGYVGRTTIQTGGIRSGHVNQKGDSIMVANGDEAKISKNFEILQSYLTGLRREMTNFSLNVAGDLKPTFEIFSTEEIVNNSPSQVTQVLIHKSRMAESSTVTTWSSWSSTTEFSMDVGVQVSIPLEEIGCPCSLDLDLSLQFGMQFSESGKTTNSVHQENEKEVVVTKNITLAPHTSIQACSVVVKLEDFEGDYTAMDVFSAPGLTADQVNNILIADGITGGSPFQGDSVAVPVDGQIAADIFVTTRLYITPIDETGLDPCSLSSLKSKGMKRARELGLSPFVQVI